jgi:hypothetical protein
LGYERFYLSPVEYWIMGDRWRSLSITVILLLLMILESGVASGQGLDGLDSKTRLGEAPPSPPRDLDYSQQAHEITLKWKSPSDWGDWKEWRGYHIYYIDGYGNQRTADTIRDPEKTHTHKMVRYGWEYFVAAETDINKSSYIGPLIPKDTVGPWVEVMSYPDEIFFNRLYNISASVHERNTINRVALEFSMENGTVIFNNSMERIGGDNEGEYYSANFYISPTDSKISFRVVSCDSAGNWNSTRSYEVEVIEENNPVLLDDRTPDSVPEGSYFEFQVEAKDDTSIFIVEIFYRRAGGSMERIVLNRTTGNNFSAPFFVGGDIRSIYYKVKIVDVFGNFYTTHDERKITVQDLTPPAIHGYWIGGEARTGEYLEFTINASDNDRLMKRILICSFDNSSEVSLEVEGDSHSLFIEPHVREITYHWIVIDRSGYNASTIDEFVPVRDILPPTVDLIDEVDIPTTGDEFSIIAQAEDNHNLSDVTLYYRFGENSTIKVSWLSDSGSGYIGSFMIPFDFVGILEYWISAADLQGNIFNTSISRHKVQDNDPPNLQFIEDQEGIVGQFFEMYIVYNDNIGVNRVVWSDSPGDSQFDRMYFTPIYPIHQLVTVTVYDEAGNSVERQFMIRIDDDDHGSGQSGGSTDFSSNEEDDLSTGCCISVIVMVVLISILVALIQNRFKTAKNDKSSTIPNKKPAAPYKGAVDEDSVTYDVGDIMIEVRDGVDDDGLDLRKKIHKGPVPGEVKALEDIHESEVPFEEEDPPMIIETGSKEGPRVLSAPPGFAEE